MSLTIEQKKDEIAELQKRIDALRSQPNRPYELVRIKFDGHGLQTRKGDMNKIIALSEDKQMLIDYCIDQYEEEPQEIPKKSIDRKYTFIYHIRPSFIEVF